MLQSQHIVTGGSKLRANRCAVLYLLMTIILFHIEKRYTIQQHDEMFTEIKLR